MQRRTPVILPALLCAAALPRPAHAQSPAAHRPAIEAILVTARKRPESAQKVPLSVTVINGPRANQNNQYTLHSLLTAVPDAQFRTNSTNNQRTLFVRGIGTISTSPGVEPSVSTVIDGVVLGRSGQTVLDLISLQQIEVLAGPQGTLFGKNASAGVVNITTLAPQRTPHAWAESDYYGSNGTEYRLTAGATGALSPTLSGIIAATTDDFSGNVRNLYTGQRVNGTRDAGFRGKLLYQPSDQFDATLAADYVHAYDTVPNGVFVNSGQLAYPGGAYIPNLKLAKTLAAQGIAPSPNNTNISNNVTGNETDDNAGVALTMNRQFDAGTLTSITAWRIWNNTHLADYDETSAPPGDFSQIRDSGTLQYNQYSQEIRLASPKGGLVDYVIGGYAFYATENETYQRADAPAKTPTAVTAIGESSYGTDANNEALFGEANLNITPQLRAIAGIRLIHDGLSYYENRIATPDSAASGIRPSYASSNDSDHDDYSARLGLQYDILPTTNAYFTYSRGYKSPAYNVFLNMQETDTQVLKPETNNSYEIGLKSSLLDNRLQASIAGFIEDFSNFQANFSYLVDGAVVLRLINAGSVSSSGAQAALTAYPIAPLRLSLSAIYDDAHIDNFNCPPGAASNCNVNGQPLPFAPRYKLASNATYTLNLNDAYDLALATFFTWQSKTQYQLTETPGTIQQAYGIWNANLSLLNLPHSWRVTAVVNNILDQHYASFLAPGNLAGIVRFVPRDNSRYFGVQLRADF